MHSLRSLLLGALLAILNPAIAAPVPEDVVKLAEAYIKAHPDELSPHRRSKLDEYAASFFRGFLSPRGGNSTHSSLQKEAYEQGQARWRQGAAARDQVFAGYGYARVELTGEWSLAFEMSLFKSKGICSNCWLELMADNQSDVPRPRRDDDSDTRRVRVIGYVSQVGKHGHQGMYDRELLALSVMQVKP